MENSVDPDQLASDNFEKSIHTVHLLGQMW